MAHFTYVLESAFVRQINNVFNERERYEEKERDNCFLQLEKNRYIRVGTLKIVKTVDSGE